MGANIMTKIPWVPKYIKYIQTANFHWCQMHVFKIHGCHGTHANALYVIEIYMAMRGTRDLKTLMRPLNWDRRGKLTTFNFRPQNLLEKMLFRVVVSRKKR